MHMQFNTSVCVHTHAHTHFLSWHTSALTKKKPRVLQKLQTWLRFDKSYKNPKQQQWEDLSLTHTRTSREERGEKEGKGGHWRHTNEQRVTKREREASKKNNKTKFPWKERYCEGERPKGVWGVDQIVLQRRRKEQEEDAYIWQTGEKDEQWEGVIHEYGRRKARRHSISPSAVGRKRDLDAYTSSTSQLSARKGQRSSPKINK